MTIHYKTRHRRVTIREDDWSRLEEYRRRLEGEFLHPVTMTQAVKVLLDRVDGKKGRTPGVR